MPSPSMVVACLALTIALSGASYAAIVLPRNSVGTPQLKANAVKSGKVALNTLKGVDINESTLGQVPSAANAAHANAAEPLVNAGNADLLNGKNSSAFAAAGVDGWREVGAVGEPAFEEGWTNYGSGYSTAAFYKDPWGVVHLKGLVKSGIFFDSIARVFRLPVGYRPAGHRVFATISNEAFARVDVIASDGRVRPGAGGNTAWFSARRHQLSSGADFYRSCERRSRHLSGTKQVSSIDRKRIRPPTGPNSFFPTACVMSPKRPECRRLR